MKLLSYNIHHSSQDKLNKVLRYDADVYILPELANPSRLNIPQGYEARWIGDIAHKGLGVLWKSALKGETPEWLNPAHNYFLPVLIDGKLIVAAWPTTTKANAPKGYPQIVMEALQEYAPYLRQYPCVISGDMNCYKGQSKETKEFGIESVFTFLRELGFVSVYHQETKEFLGAESAVTYYHHFKSNSKFFLDYTFTNIPYCWYQLEPWDLELSDHVAQYMEF